MNFKFYYYEDEKVCVISSNTDEKPAFRDIVNGNCAIKIYVENKNVENLYNFFKENTITQLLSSNPSEILIDYSSLEENDFSSEDSFIKLKELIEQVKEKCNETIRAFSNDDSELNMGAENHIEGEEESEDSDMPF